MLGILVALATLAVGTPMVVLAEDEASTALKEAIVTDRPTDSASPELVPQKSLQVEMGYKFSRFNTESGRTDTQELPDLLARFGISDKVEGRLTATGWTFQDTDTGRHDGFTDVSLGAKFALADERGWRPQMSLLADMSLPVGDSAFTNDYVIPKVLFLATSSLTDRLGLTYNLGPSFVTRKKNGETRREVTLHYAVALSCAVGRSVSVFGELYGVFFSGQGLPDRHSFQAGTTVLLSRNVQIDVRGGLGLADNAPDWLAGVGIAFRLPL